MSIEKCLSEMKKIQDKFLEFLEDDENVEENFQNLFLILEDIKIRDNKHELRLFLRHIASVCANHHHCKNFFDKIERLLQIFKDDIQKNYSNSEIFNIFKKNKRIILYLIEEKMLIFDEYVAKKIIDKKYVKKKYPQYFAPEIQPFSKERWFPKYDGWIKEIKEDLPANFYELRKIGENEKYICQLIRDDNAKDFIKYVNQSSIPLDSQIEPSIYETNTFLIKKQDKSNNKNGVTLIEYAAFFGSIKIINYLQMKQIELTPSLWLYAIHSQNAKLIHFLEESHIGPTVTVHKDNQKLYEELIKCNHNAIVDYFINNYLQDSDQISNVTFIQSLKYCNFEFLQKEQVNESLFYQLCAYDYYLIAEYLFTNNDININRKIIQIISFNYIQNHIFQWNSIIFI